jgi:hypothetical protein
MLTPTPDWPLTPVHVSSEADLTILWCRCGWRSPELSRSQVSDLGIPWYCDNCGKAHVHWVTFAPAERARALSLVNHV